MIVDRDAVCDCEPCYPRSLLGTWIFFKRKCREIGESPSMMWKRSIVQGCGRLKRASAPALALAFVVLAAASGARGADLVIEIPGSGAGDGGQYRLDYRPPHGSPAPNHTVPARASTINFQGLPGTKYHFMLYYSNDTFADLLTWNQTIITAPEPPTNLTVALGRNKQATISWSPPAHGDYTGFRFKVVPLTERAEGGARNITLEGGNWTHVLRDLSPGATYQLHAFTLLHDKDSAAYASRNFTTKPNTPGKFIVWFRNETTLLVLWQPPYPPGFYTHYKVSIVPADARESELYVEKEGEPPGPAQAAFKGLVPGRAYNISVQTVSEPEISAPTTAQYRTVPLRPRNVTAPAHDLTETSFRVVWLPPQEESEFEKYQVSVAGDARRLPAVVRARDEPAAATFEGLEPGAHYAVTVKTMSGKVTSWPATADLTLKPLPVRALRVSLARGALAVSWAAAAGSTQDEYRVSYHEAGPARDDASALVAAAPNVTLEALLPGRNYSVTVTAVSRGVESDARAAHAATRPLAPLVLAAEAGARELRLTWRSDVTSRQDEYRLRYARAAPAAQEWRTIATADTNATLEELFPGAVYEVQVAALSHGLLSEDHVLLKPVRPLPPRSLVVQRATSNSVTVEWSGPERAASAVGEYTLRYRTLSQATWTTLPPLPALATRAEIANMTHGERYAIELDSGSERAAGGESAASGAPRRAEHTVRPEPVSNVAQLADTRNVTLEWPRAAGRVERYALRWRARDPPAGAERAADVPDPGAGAAAVRALLPGLEPGQGYSIAVTAISYNLTSEEFTMETRTRPLIQSEMTFVNEADNGEGEEAPPSILVTYTPTPAAATLFDAYRFRLEPGEEAAGAGAQHAARAAADPARRVLFADLTPGALYNVTMWTVSCNVTSHPVQRQARLFPRAIAWLNATRVGAREVTLAWARPAGVFSDFEVQYLAAADTLRTHTAAAAGLTLSGLRPHTLYTFTVVVRAGAAGALRTVSRAVSAAVATAQAPPPPPRGFHPQDAAPSRLDFVWALPPEDANGVLQRFELQYWPQDEPDRVRTAEFPPEARSGSVSGLAPGAAYEFALAAATGAGRGAAAHWSQRMSIGAPPRPAPDALPAPAAASPTTVAVRFRADYFSAANGNVTAYTLVVAEEPRDAAPLRLPAWRDVQRLPRWPPYQATEPYYPFRAGGREEEFTIGSERCEGGGRAYCNGPLKPGTRYFVKLRAFTAPDKFTDTAYTEVHTGGQHGVDHRRVRGAGAGRGRRGRRAGAAAAARRPRGARAAAARAARLAPRARRRLRRPLPAHVGRLRLPLQRGVRGAEARGPRAAVLGGRPARQPAQEPVHQHPAVRPLALQAAAGGRRGGLGLHQRQLRAGALVAARVHRDAGPAALHARRLLAHGVGVGLARHRHADAVRGEGPREVRPVLAVRHAARVLRRHRRHGAQRVALPRLDRHRADAVPRLRAARRQALPLHDVAGLRRARPAHGAGAVRARLPRPLPAGRAPGRRALQRRRRPLRHLHHAGHGAAAAGARRGLAGHLRHGARDAARARVDGADGAAVHLHPSVPGGGAGGTGPRAAAAQPPPQPCLRRRRRHRGVRHVSRRRTTSSA